MRSSVPPGRRGASQRRSPSRRSCSSYGSAAGWIADLADPPALSGDGLGCCPVSAVGGRPSVQIGGNSHGLAALSPIPSPSRPPSCLPRRRKMHDAVRHRRLPMRQGVLLALILLLALGLAEGARAAATRRARPPQVPSQV